MNILKPLLGTMRIPFLILTPACVMVGVGTAYWQSHQLNWLNIFLVLVGAISAHISVNVFNEYFDFKSGLDAKTARTPFSGGSGALPANPKMERATVWLAWIAFAITAAIGLYFLWLRGWQLLPIGLFGLLLLITYTTWWVNHPILCLIAPGLGFGLLMVMGTHFALTGMYSWTSFVAALVPSFLVSDLLLLNQFPDVEPDRSVGRRHFPITIGRKKSSLLYGVLLALAYLCIVFGMVLSLLPGLSAIALLTTTMAWRVYQGAKQHAENVDALMPAMGMNVVINVATPVLLAISFFVG